MKKPFNWSGIIGLSLFIIGCYLLELSLTGIIGCLLIIIGAITIVGWWIKIHM